MTFCLVFIIWFIILLIVRKKVGNNPAKAKADKAGKAGIEKGLAAGAKTMMEFISDEIVTFHCYRTVLQIQ